MSRQVGLVAVVVVAVVLLLFGLSAVATPSTPAPSLAAASPRPAASVARSSAPVESSSPSALATVSASPSATGATAAPGASAVPTPTPTPAPTPYLDEAGNAVLVGAGDIADCRVEGDSATADLIAGIKGTVFAAGDDAYDAGTPKEFADCYGPTWGRFLERTRPVPGNHDWLTKDLAGYLGYFGSRAAPDGTSWYSFDAGSWHVVMLDSECLKVGGCGVDSAQGRWLAADLAASKAKCTLAIWHKPRWSSGFHGDIRSVGTFWDQLYAAGADLVINGHDHDYERFAPQDPSGHEDRTRGSARVRGRDRRRRAPRPGQGRREQRVPPRRHLRRPQADLEGRQLRLGLHPHVGWHPRRGYRVLPLTDGVSPRRSPRGRSRMTVRWRS